jgi:hypothetical protein
MVALSSKGDVVFNVMAFKRRNAWKYITKEYENIRRLVQIVDSIEMPVL